MLEQVTKHHSQNLDILKFQIHLMSILIYR